MTDHCISCNCVILGNFYFNDDETLICEKCHDSTVLNLDKGKET